MCTATCESFLINSISGIPNTALLLSLPLPVSEFLFQKLTNHLIFLLSYERPYLPISLACKSYATLRSLAVISSFPEGKECYQSMIIFIKI